MRQEIASKREKGFLTAFTGLMQEGKKENNMTYLHSKMEVLF